MGDALGDTNKVNVGAVQGVPRNTTGPANDAYEYGTMVSVSRTGRYKSFTNPFTAAPVVVLTPINTTPTGTVIPRLISAPVAGSFHAALAAVNTGGSMTLHYMAFGPR